MESNQDGMAELDEFLSGTKDDMDSQEIEDFMRAEEIDDSESIEDWLGFSEEEEIEQGLTGKMQALEAEGSFSKSDDETGMAENADILELLNNEFSEDITEDNGSSRGVNSIPDLDEENELVDIMSGFSDITDEIPLTDESSQLNDVIEKVTLLQKLKMLFRKKELTEEQKLQIEQEEEEERRLEEKIKEEREIKKQEKEAKKQEKKDEDENKKKEKEVEKARKKEEKSQKKQNDVKDQKPQTVSVKPMIFIVLIGVSFICLFMLTINIKFYNTSMKSAKKYFIHQKYDVAYEELIGLNISKKDKEFYDQVRIIRMLDIKREAYGQYIKLNQYPEALKSLISGAEKYEKNKDKAAELGVNTEFETIYSSLTGELSAKFGVSIEDAKALYEMTDKEAYDSKINELARAAAIKDGVVEEVKIQKEQS